MKKDKLEGVIISSVPNIIYLTGYDNFSKEDRDAFIIVTGDKQYIVTHELYAEEVEVKVKDFKLLELKAEKRASQIIGELFRKGDRLGIEEDDLSIGEYRRLLKGFKTKHFRVDRSVKGPDEIKKLKKACQISDQAFNHVLGEIHEGITEKELVKKLEQFMRDSGADVAFPTVVAFGANSSVPHHRADQTKLKKGDFILIDFGAKFENYSADVCRTLVFGNASEKQRRLYNAVLAAQTLAVIESGKSVAVSELDKVARDYIKSQGYQEYPHALGHGIGIEVHEKPHLYLKNKEVLEEGMVLTLEPGSYIPGFGGVRIEDDYLYEEGRLKELTESPKALIEL